MGEGGEKKGRPDTKPFSKSCDTSKIWMWQWLDNTQYSLTSSTASKYEQSNRHGEAIEIFNRCFGFMWYFYGQRRWEEFKKALEGALKFFLDGIESCCVGVEGSSKSIWVRRFSPSALSVFLFHLSPSPPETPDTQAIMCMAIVNWSLNHAPKFCTVFTLATSQSPTLMILTAVFF